ncbi:helix-turn-helix domain-containing protein [Halobacteriovorax sp. JY17]|uniref:helix-turn-helix domain-containing protein n=1 Tax=Halobacteriovorax sp. JY17 TaxID=2014617 RepID=UPI000C49035C|nr:helix-turn-helix domain-containing protein [Halobacteriovorax sp. JY17]PIK15519.1 MAG: hypothetical protein CES88_02015 [Halobacteriovorax sp. JY17]
MRKLLKVKEVAEILNTSEAHVRGLVFYRKIPFSKVGRSIRFRPEKIENWLSTNSNE